MIRDIHASPTRFLTLMSNDPTNPITSESRVSEECIVRRNRCRVQTSSNSIFSPSTVGRSPNLFLHLAQSAAAGNAHALRGGEVNAIPFDVELRSFLNYSSHCANESSHFAWKAVNRKLFGGLSIGTLNRTRATIAYVKTNKRNANKVRQPKLRLREQKREEKRMRRGSEGFVSCTN